MDFIETRRAGARMPVVLRRTALLAIAAVGLAGTTAATPSAARFTDGGVVSVPLRAAGGEPLLFDGLDAGDAHSIGWTEDGELFAWGSNADGQLGIGAEPDHLPVPTPVELPDGAVVVDASAGPDTTIALTQDGEVYTWGSSQAGDTPVPQRVAVEGLSGNEWVRSVHAGGQFYLALTSRGRLFSWGSDLDGRLGRPTHATPAEVPGRVPLPTGLSTVYGASAGRSHIAVVLGDGVLLRGQDVDGGQDGVMVTGIEGRAYEVAAGDRVTLVRTTEGRVFLAEGRQAVAVLSSAPAGSGR